ncbi:MAG TPA: hypothetical protein VL485_10605 [Ktedonobacteraceae bacterium]|nr:hypothetical protein [Ktedonobacteraceae bacterium]
MGKHIQTTSVLVCTLSTQHEGIVLQMPRSQISFAQPPISMQKARQKLF